MHSDFLVDRSNPITQPGRHDEPHPIYSADAPPPEPISAGAQIASTLAENRELRAEVEQLRAERNRLLESQRRIMELIGAPTPDKLVHDLRNVLNERDLLKALVDEME
jgi:hypothetical protein